MFYLIAGYVIEFRNFSFSAHETPVLTNIPLLESDGDVRIVGGEKQKKYNYLIE